MKDVLTLEQLQAQLNKRKAYIEQLKRADASEAMIRAAEKDMLMTLRRIERYEA